MMREIALPERPIMLAEPFNPGGAPSLQWLKIQDLVVDARYQREIAGAGAKNVRRIAAGFRWSKFAPVVVSPVEGGKFAIIDGQHRTTAALVRGVESVPCQVVIADVAEQADAFGSINGQVTRMSRLQLHAASVAAGDPDALELQSVVAAAGVTLLRQPRTLARQKPGETIALASIEWGLRNYGRETLITALTCVTETSNNVPGALCSCIIKALVQVLGENHVWRDAGEKLLALFDTVDLIEELEEATITRRPKGVVTSEVLTDRLRARLRDDLKVAA